MKKRLVITFSVLFMAIVPAKSQIFILSDEEMNNSRVDRTVDEIGVMVAGQNLHQDQFVPLGGGTLVLGCLGGAYLLGKRQKRQKK